MNILFKSRKTIFELLSDRGYSEISQPTMTREEFQEWAGSKSISEIKQQMTLEAKGSRGIVLVYWPESPKLTSHECTNLVFMMRTRNIDHAIVIIEDSVTHHTKNTLRMGKQDGLLIEVFTLQEMQFNVSHHKWVPKHQICSPEEKKKIMKTYAADRHQIPNIKTSDAMARYLGIRKGQMVRIIRDSDVMEGEKTISYRLAI